MARSVANPYYNEYRKLRDNVAVDNSPLGMLFGALGLCIIPGSETRTLLTRRYGFAIPNADALNLIASWGPVIEMGAGTGYWASLLRKMKVDVIAYDNFSGHSELAYGFGPLWTPVVKGNTARLKDHGDRTLLICWPDYGSMFASNCLRYYRGNRLLYIGEGIGGCTANDHFHKLLKKEWTLIKVVSLPTWPGIHDNLYAYERTEKIDVKASSQAVRKLRSPHISPPVRRRRPVNKRRTR